ncbi:MAG: BrnA antitoxin family protein [Bdellovibrionales bacterium]|nr:BrnA antitoxin family protein [Bdellovibrionales bacterium]
MKKEYDLAKMKVKGRGAVATRGTKVQKTVRLDLDVLAWLMKEGERRGIPYQTLINSILKEAMQLSDAGLKDLVRKLVREELKKVS